MTQPTHFPSLELCKKLTEIRFPDTEKIYSRWMGREIFWPNAWMNTEEFRIKRNPLPWDIVTDNCKEEYPCPSVMELIDQMPWEVNWFYLNIDCLLPYVSYKDTYWVELIWFEDATIPNALVSMTLWLHENKYITFPTHD